MGGCKLLTVAGCNLPVNSGRNLPLEVGYNVLVGWSTRTVGEVLVESRQSQGSDSGNMGNVHNNSKPRWKK